MRLCSLFLASLSVLPAQAFSQTVTIGTTAQYDAGDFTVAPEVLQGFERALTEAACARGQLDCVWKEMPRDELLPALRDKQIDVMVAAISASAELGDNVDMTAPYVYPDIYNIIGPAGIQMHGDVKTVATIADAAIDAWAPTTPYTIKTFPTLDDAWAGVVDGSAEVVMAEREALVPLVEKHGEQTIAILFSRRLRPGMTMALHADNIDLRFNFEDRFYDMTQDGSLNALIEEWFGDDADRW